MVERKGQDIKEENYKTMEERDKENRKRNREQKI
jgi:hypothetical protein